MSIKLYSNQKTYKMAKKEESLFYVNLEEPVEIRRNILESSKEIVQLLQRYEKIRNIRVKKSSKITDLKKQTKEIAIMVAKLKQYLPKSGLRAPPAEKGETKVIRNNPVKKIDRPPKINKLEAELKAIEDKLNRL